MPTVELIWATLFVCTFTMNTVHTGTKADDDNNPILIDVVWSEIDYKLHTIPSIQVITNPLLSQQFSPIHKQVFDNLAQLNVDYARYAAWFAYPKLVVAELDPPSGIYQCGHAGENFSVKLSCRQGGGVISGVDFASYGTPVGACGQMKQGTCHAPDTFDIVQQVCIDQNECSIPATSDLFGDPLFEDFLAATDGHSRVASFSTEPSWLYHFDTPRVYSDNASKADWFYDEGSVFVDPTMKDLGDYYGRLFAWILSTFGERKMSKVKTARTGMLKPK